MTDVNRENRLGLRIAELEAQLRRSNGAFLVREVERLTREVAKLRSSLEHAMTVAILLEGEIDLCPSEDWHASYPYTEQVRPAGVYPVEYAMGDGVRVYDAFDHGRRPIVDEPEVEHGRD